jgi:crotonobetainyl-CoA:carnitine CoA-transferase CaiB-like acyl-CoA transferase
MTEMFYEELDGKLEGETTDYWVRVLTAADVPVSAVATIEEHFSDPQVVHNRLYQGYETDEGRRGNGLGSGIPLSSTVNRLPNEWRHQTRCRRSSRRPQAK